MKDLYAEFLRKNQNPFWQGVILPSSSLAVVSDIDSKEGIVSGYFNAFGNVDAYREVVKKGAFKKTIREWGPKGAKRIKHLRHHRPSDPVATILELTEDDTGLRYVSKYQLNHTASRDAFIEVESEMLTEHSIGFDVMKYEKSTDEGGSDLLILTEIRLYEGSNVAWGANPATPVIDVKSLRDNPDLIEQMAHQIKAIGRCLNSSMSDGALMELEARLTNYRTIIAQLDSALREEFGLDPFQGAGEPSPMDTRSDDEPPSEADVLQAIHNAFTN